VPLQLDVHAPRKERAPAGELGSRPVDPAGDERARDRAFVAAGEDVEAGAVQGDVIARDEPFPLALTERAGGDQPAQVPVAGPDLDEKCEAGRLFGVREGRGASRTTSAPTIARSPAARAAL